MAELVENHVVADPTGQDISVQVATKLVEMKDVSFHFRSTDVLDNEGKPVLGSDGKPNKWKRDTFKVAIPHLTSAGLIAALQSGGKVGELVLDLVNSAGVIDRARGLINDKVDQSSWENGKNTLTLSASDLDLNQLTLTAISLVPKGERGAGISKEAWATFVADYKDALAKPEAIAMFPDRKARAPEVLEKHGILLAGKFNQVRSRKDIVQQMLGFLDIYVQVSENADANLACYELLKAKGDGILKGEEYNDL